MTGRPEPELPPLHESLTWLTPLSEERAAGLVEFVADPEPADVLDLGCGWGELLLRVLAAAPRHCAPFAIWSAPEGAWSTARPSGRPRPTRRRQRRCPAGTTSS